MSSLGSASYKDILDEFDEFGEYREYLEDIYMKIYMKIEFQEKS